MVSPAFETLVLSETELMVIAPAPLVTVILVPAESVLRANPLPFPIMSCPLAGVESRPVPPREMGMIPDEISAAAKDAHAGVVAAEPVPVLVKNCLVLDVLPPSRVPAPPAPPTIMSPGFVMGERALKAADAVVAPVPPLSNATTPVTFVALPERFAVIVPPLTALPETLPAVVIVANLESEILALLAISPSTIVVDPEVTRPLLSTVTLV